MQAQDCPATDGASTKQETIEEHYDHNFDILAVTDHGTTDYGWDDPSTNKAVKIAMTVRKGNLPIKALSSKGETTDGKSMDNDTVGLTYNSLCDLGCNPEELENVEVTIEPVSWCTYLLNQPLSAWSVAQKAALAIFIIGTVVSIVINFIFNIAVNLVFS